MGTDCFQKRGHVDVVVGRRKGPVPAPDISCAAVPTRSSKPCCKVYGLILFNGLEQLKAIGLIAGQCVLDKNGNHVVMEVS